MGRILLVEDNDDLRDIFAEVLRRDGYTVVEAGDGQVALQLLQQLDPAPGLVLLDLMMPKVSGLDVLRHVAESDRLSGIPIVIVSASAESLRGTGRPVLGKPVEPRSLLEVVRRYLPHQLADAHEHLEIEAGPRSSRRPRTSRASAANPPSPSLPLDLLRVLLVEDDVDSLDLLAFSLESRGAIVTSARSFAEAVAAMSVVLPDVVVTDVELTDGDGYTLLQTLRNVPGASGLPGVALTGHATEAARNKAKTAGFDHFLTKPVSLTELGNVLLRLTDQKPSARAAGEPLDLHEESAREASD